MDQSPVHWVDHMDNYLISNYRTHQHDDDTIVSVKEQVAVTVPQTS